MDAGAVPEYPIRRHNLPPLRADAALLDDSRLVLWVKCSVTLGTHSPGQPSQA
ncbi:MAG: hypothetical protein ACE14M_13490 [Terriglobales bacterium]